LIGIAFLGSSQWSIRSAQCCISFVREPKSASSPSPMSNFGRAARQSTFGQICFGVAPAPSLLRAICSIPSFGIAKFVAIVLISDANKNANKLDGWSKLFTSIFNEARKFS